MNGVATVMVQRLDDVTVRLRGLSERGSQPGALTSPDPPTGERWEAGQVWAHVAEFIPYWVGEVAIVVAHGSTEPAAFGRTKADPERNAAIERERHSDRLALWQRIAADIAGLRILLVDLAPTAWEARGGHSTMGVIDLRGIVDEFLVGHLEQHAAQLEDLAD